MVFYDLAWPLEPAVSTKYPRRWISTCSNIYEIKNASFSQYINNFNPDFDFFSCLDKLSSGMVPVSSALIEHLGQGDDQKDGAKVKSIPLLSSLGKYNYMYTV